MIKLNTTSSIKNLDISNRTKNALILAGIRTISDLSQTTLAKLSMVRGLGNYSINEIRQCLDEMNGKVELVDVDFERLKNELSEKEIKVNYTTYMNESPEKILNESLNSTSDVNTHSDNRFELKVLGIKLDAKKELQSEVHVPKQQKTVGVSNPVAELVKDSETGSISHNERIQTQYIEPKANPFIRDQGYKETDLSKQIKSSNIQLSYQKFTKLKKILVNEYYSIEEFISICNREFPEEFGMQISEAGIKSLGFQLYSDFIIRSSFLSLDDFFQWIFTYSKSSDMSNWSSGMKKALKESRIIDVLKSSWDLFEMRPNTYISLKKLKPDGVTREDFKSFCDDIRVFVSEGEYFTYHYLNIKGFQHTLQTKIKDDSLMIQALKASNSGFSYCEYEKNVLFVHSKQKPVFADFLRSLASKQKANSKFGNFFNRFNTQSNSFCIDDIQKELERTYGIYLPIVEIERIVLNT